MSLSQFFDLFSFIPLSRSSFFFFLPTKLFSLLNSVRLFLFENKKTTFLFTIVASSILTTFQTPFSVFCLFLFFFLPPCFLHTLCLSSIFLSIVWVSCILSVLFFSLLFITLILLLLLFDRFFFFVRHHSL